MCIKRTIKVSTFVLLFALFTFGLINVAQAGFGVSPPYVTSDNLAQGSHYEQKIVIVRGDPTESLNAEITIDVPTAGDWITIDKGEEFILPEGEQQVPMVVSVDVPNNAEYGNYKGTIKIKTSSSNNELEGGQVAIELGAQIDVDITVGEAITDYQITGVRVVDTEEGFTRWFLHFPGVIQFIMRLENFGSASAVPSKVHLDIYTNDEKTLLESIETTDIEKVEPFETKEIIARLLTQLPSGSYWASYEIYKDQEIIQEGKVHLSIMPAGSIEGYTQQAGLKDLPTRDKLILGVIVFLPIIIAVFIILSLYKFFRWRQSKKRLK